MSITELPRSVARTTATYQLRLHGGTEDERLISVPPGKHSVGAGPRCQIRLDVPGVGAMECLLVCDRAGLRVRRWSDKTVLNGQPFEEANLAVGDVLKVGPIELVVVVPGGHEVPAARDHEDWAENSIQSACDAIDDIFLADEGAATSTVGTWQDDRPSRPTQRIVRTTPSAPVSPPAPTASADSLTKSAVRRRSRRALAVIRRQRQDHDELLARVGELEQMLAQAIAEPVAAQSAPDESSRQDLTAPNVGVDLLESRLAVLQDQLAVRDSDLKQARYSIDVLERQLIDSQHTMNAFAEERVQWEQQFNEIELRLAKYISRIHELEQQLESSTAPAVNDSTITDAEAEPRATVDSHEAGIDWETEFAQTTASEPVVALPHDIAEPVDAEVHERVTTATTVEDMPTESAIDEYDWQDTIEEPATETSEADIETAVAPEWEPAATSIGAAEGVAESTPDVSAAAGTQPEPAPTDEPNDVEQALELLRGVSIWREEPAENSEAVTAYDGSHPAEPAETQKGAAPFSFLDRYAHMFPDDDGAATPILHEDTTAQLREAVPPPEAHTDEESVEQYMAKLLARMRGGPAGSAKTGDPARAENVTPLPQPANGDPPAPAVEQPKFANLDEMKTKASAPEQPSDMAAMRALANQSARHALSLHAARKLRRTAITRVIVTALAASVSIYLLLNASTWRSLAFAAGCAAGFAAFYWAMLTMGTLLKGFQLGAFDDYEEELTPEKSLNPPLPIDVEQPASEQDAAAAAE